MRFDCIRLKCLFFLLPFGLIIISKAEKAPPSKLYHIAPLHWYVGYSDPQLEIILHAENISMIDLHMEEYEGVTFTGKSSTINRHVCYLQLQILPTAKPGMLKFFSRAQVQVRGLRYIKPFKFEYELKARSPGIKNKVGLNSSDLMYLILPDRFVNGNPKNDNATVKNPEKANRSELKSRHGGDLTGITAKLPYLQSLGVTALWLNPVQANDQPKESYHGYAVTDHYMIDPRLGTNAEYLKLSADAHKLGLKLVMDIIPNHFGSLHWMYENFDTGWFNQWDSFTRTNYRAYTLMDPYASPSEAKLNLKGWFDRSMPDVNQQNPHMARYLDQMYLWWIEYAALDGYRIDTWPYADPDYMNHMVQLLQAEYPGFGIFGETWVNGTGTQLAFVKNNIKGFEKNQLPGVTDFQLCFAMNNALVKPFGWTDGLNQIYQTLSDDYLYQDPLKNCIFLDNHDMNRIFSHVSNNTEKWKMAIALLMTQRGIPCLYYGTEILMTGTTQPTDALVRADFPGGWNGDKLNKFEIAGRSAAEKMAWDYISNLANYRRVNTVLQTGKTMQYAGIDSTYVYFRYNNEKTILVVCNQGNTVKNIAISRFSDRMAKFSKAKNIVSKQIIELGEFLQLRPNTADVYELIP